MDKGDEACGTCVPTEIERKFLIEYPDTAWLSAQPGCRRMEIVQTYLINDAGWEERVRRKLEQGRERYVHTLKRGNGIRREEIEESISRAQYETLLERADPARRPVVKTRFMLPVGAQMIEIDLYPEWRDRAIAEVELRDEAEPIVFPEEIRVMGEVTYEPAYKNAALAMQR